jgi:hypothetical protein
VAISEYSGLTEPISLSLRLARAFSRKAQAKQRCSGSGDNIRLEAREIIQIRMLMPREAYMKCNMDLQDRDFDSDDAI